MTNKEIRTIDIADITTRNLDNSEAPVIGGYAAVFNSKTMIGRKTEEVILPGAFNKAIANSDVRALFNHNWDKVLGRTKNGTLRLSEDERGLKFEVDLPNTTAARDLAVSMSRGDISQCSFGFIVTDESLDFSGENVLRTIKEVELFEISVVALPAYGDTEAALVRSKEFDHQLEKRLKIINQIKGVLNNE